MKIKSDLKNKLTIISDIEEFDLIKTLKSGQTFRYFEIDKDDKKGFVVIDENVATYLESLKNGLIVYSVDKHIVDKWIQFFNLKTDYKKIKKDIIKIDNKMKNYITKANGVRIIKQDEWTTILTFIISANNNMPRIKKSVNLIAETYGKYITTIEGIKCYSMPSPNKLSKIKQDELRKLGVGFRDKYLIDAAYKITKKEFDLEKAKSLTSSELKNELMKIKGIGNKVADCIRLIGYNKMESFPVDVWIERFMLEVFLNDGKKYTREKIEKYGQEKFKDIAGYAQQYIFYYCVTELKNNNE